MKNKGEYKRGRENVDHVFALKITIEKHLEKGRKLFTAVTELKKTGMVLGMFSEAMVWEK